MAVFQSMQAETYKSEHSTYSPARQAELIIQGCVDGTLHQTSKETTSILGGSKQASPFSQFRWLVPRAKNVMATCKRDSLEDGHEETEDLYLIDFVADWTNQEVF